MIGVPRTPILRHRHFGFRRAVHVADVGGGGRQRFLFNRYDLRQGAALRAHAVAAGDPGLVLGIRSAVFSSTVANTAQDMAAVDIERCAPGCSR